jgi:hypothetical protein
MDNGEPHPLAPCCDRADHCVRLLLKNEFILLFLRMSYHLKCFKIINKIIHKIHDFILEFYNCNTPATLNVTIVNSSSSLELTLVFSTHCYSHLSS